MTNNEWLRLHLQVKAGMAPPRAIDECILAVRWSDLVQVYATRMHPWSEEASRLMQARIIMGGYRYGLASVRRYDHKKQLRIRFNRWLDDHNDEHLIDAMNFAMLAGATGQMPAATAGAMLGMLMETYLTDQHPDRHFVSIDDGIHSERSN